METLSACLKWIKRRMDLVLPSLVSLTFRSNMQLRSSTLLWHPMESLSCPAPETQQSSFGIWRVYMLLCLLRSSVFQSSFLPEKINPECEMLLRPLLQTDCHRAHNLISRFHPTFFVVYCCSDSGCFILWMVNYVLQCIFSPGLHLSLSWKNWVCQGNKTLNFTEGVIV